ncbi:phosphatidylserine/phosphatidylglycerophosphate/cardiolipin synthase family protein [Kocuria palustris]|uniref:phospholipase D-like domain-containing protein n=1 Tax=Kocuria palustris TaxID=71999 RepID=UPI0011AA913B|nr:phospholipase D-like domain-containing protein [Kocuria palustris]
MLTRIPQPVRRIVARTAARAAVGVVAVQATTIAGLVGYDAVKKHYRKSRSGFPKPGHYGADVAGSDMEVFTYGAELYDDMIASIDAAQRTVYLETYLWKGDEYGRRFRDALNRAGARGVDVKVIYDGVGNMVVDPRFYRFGPGVQAYRFPVVRPRLLVTPLRASGLTHRKLLIVDDQYSYIGGYNLGSTYATEWRDTHLKIFGADSWQLRQAFVATWNTIAARKFEQIERLNPTEWESRVRVLTNMPVRRVYPIRNMYLQAIDQASRSIFISTAYFIPDQQILDALIRARHRGVDVRLMFPAESNHVVADWASRGFYSQLLREDITVLQYQHAMIHAKTATIDGIWSTIGTANIDRLSLSFNYEVNIEIVDRDLAAVMERIFEFDSDNCHRVTKQEWDERHPLAWVGEAALAPFRPLL